MFASLDDKSETSVGEVTDSKRCVGFGSTESDCTQKVGLFIIARATDNGDLIHSFLCTRVELPSSVVLQKQILDSKNDV